MKDLGELYVHGRDKDGKLLMVFAVRRHIKGTENMDDLKKFFLYQLERIERSAFYATLFAEPTFAKVGIAIIFC